jgi:hypothetical protein
MHKRKDGKVVASLTEVKNKTGDIFSLVDEFGEVVLTSYNKPRYRITKITVSDILDIQEKPEAPEVKEEKPRSVIHRVRETVTNLTKPVKKEEVPEEEWTGLLPKEVMAKLTSFKPWDSNSKEEQKFLKNALNPLQ